jgi:dsRNA-specific ribonuclease
MSKKAKLRKQAERLAKQAITSSPRATYRRFAPSPASTKAKTFPSFKAWTLFPASLRSHLSHFGNWLQGYEREHFGPTSRIQDLFQRRDHVYFGLANQQLQWYQTKPSQSHDIFKIAANVFHIEETIGYTFKNRLHCVEALKMSGRNYSIYFNGTIHTVLENKRLALLGDRALSMALCEIWYNAGHTLKEYSLMEQDTVTRQNLGLQGRLLNFHEDILKNEGISNHANNSMVAETVEAILGAVYIDAGRSLPAVTAVIKNLKLDEHEFLQAKLDEMDQSSGIDM